MKNIIYYFSGTGNSLKLAKDLAKELDDAQLIDIATVKDQNKVTAKSIGIVFPVYIWGLPLIVKRFVEQLEIPADAYLFAIANYGGFPGATNLQLRKILHQKGNKLAAAWGITMPGNYTPMYGAISLDRQQKMFKKAKEKIVKIAKDVTAKKKGPIKKNFFLVNWIFSGLIYGYSARYIPQMAKDFWLNDKCNGCAVCAQICPVENIEMKDGKPVWAEKCEQCLACLQWCPQEAIEFGKKTPGRKRYRHPDIKMQELQNV
jgi:ferredoxin